jgi:hypothetical protein
LHSLFRLLFSHPPCVCRLFRSFRSFPIVNHRIDRISQVSKAKKKRKPIAIDLLSRLLHRSPKSSASTLLPLQIGSNLENKRNTTRPTRQIGACVCSRVYTMHAIDQTV